MFTAATTLAQILGKKPAFIYRFPHMRTRRSIANSPSYDGAPPESCEESCKEYQRRFGESAEQA
jgi:hypothetical protein